MKKKTLVLLAAPIAALSLGLSACGGGSAPGAPSSSGAAPTSAAPTSAAPTSAAPSTPVSSPAAPSTDAPAPSTSESGDNISMEDVFGSGESKVKLDDVAKGFAQELGGATTLTNSQVRKTLEMAKGLAGMMKDAKYSPAECKAESDAALSSMSLADDTNVAMVTSGTGKSVMFIDDPNQGYLKQFAASMKYYEGPCKDVSLELDLGGQKMKSSNSSSMFTPAGIQGDLVLGVNNEQMTETSSTGKQSSKTSSVIVVRGTRAIQVNGSSEAEAVELAKQAQDYWAAN